MCLSFIWTKYVLVHFTVLSTAPGYVLIRTKHVLEWNKKDELEQKINGKLCQNKLFTRCIILYTCNFIRVIKIHLVLQLRNCHYLNWNCSTSIYRSQFSNVRTCHLSMFILILNIFLWFPPYKTICFFRLEFVHICVSINWAITIITSKWRYHLRSCKARPVNEKMGNFLSTPPPTNGLRMRFYCLIFISSLT